MNQGISTTPARSLLTADDVSTIVVPDSVIRSSRDRGWVDVQVVQRRHPTQTLNVPPLNSHLLIIYQGNATIKMVAQIGDQEVEQVLRPGALAIVPAGQMSSWYWRGEFPPFHDALHIYVAPPRVSIAADRDVVPSDLVGVFGAYDPQLAMLGQAFLDEITYQRVGEELYVDALTTMLAVHLLRRHAREHAPLAKEPPGIIAAADLRRLNEYIEAMLHQSLSLTELAGIVHLSPHHFARVFKRTTGQSPHQFVISRRVERARQLLLLGNLSIAEIATLVGFADQSHLSAHMRRQLGVSPRQLRAGARSS